jgi:hypothetical protein
MHLIDFKQIWPIQHSMNGIGYQWRNNSSEWHYISFKSIRNQRNQLYQWSGLGWNWWTSSIGGKNDLEWHYISVWNTIDWLEIKRIPHYNISFKLQIKDQLNSNIESEKASLKSCSNWNCYPLLGIKWNIGMEWVPI